MREKDMGNKDDVVIVSAVRTPFSRFGGALRQIHSIDLAVMVIKECLKRINLSGEELDEFYYGMCIQSEAALESNVNGRQALLRAGLPPDLLSLTIDRACCSSLTSVILGYRAIKLDEADVCIAVGTENMSNTPLVLNGWRWGTGLQPMTFKDHINPITYTGFNHLAKDAGDVALQHDITREMQDEWALGSQQKYQKAYSEGKFQDELMSLEIPQRKGEPLVFDKDEFPKPDTTPEGLSKLKTVYGSPTVTAGNAPGLDAGASAIIITRRSKAEALGIKPLAKLVSLASVALPPDKIAEAPAPAISKAIDRAGITLDDLDLIEINEAFAAMPLVSTKILAGGDEKKWKELLDKTNVNGGAVAIGHPVGASGGRVLMTLMYELQRRKSDQYGVCAICGGLAQGDSAVISIE
jgi:acetyl-CoA C-acetyltransferase